MHPLVLEIKTCRTPDELSSTLAEQPGIVLLRSSLFGTPHSRYSFVAARPFLVFESRGSHCSLDWRVSSEGPEGATQREVHFGNPWHLLDDLMCRFELLDELDLPFPLGGCFGYWGYDLKNFVEPRLPRRSVNDLEIADCEVGFYDSLVVFDHSLDKTWIVSTGLGADGARSVARAQMKIDFWRARLESAESETSNGPASTPPPAFFQSSLSESQFIERTRKIQAYIRQGDIYQANLSHRLSLPLQDTTAWELFLRLSAVSPAPFSGYMNCGEFQIVSSSPELFLRASGSQIVTRPIKGTRPRSTDPNRDAQLAYELQSSAKEMAELIMITDLLRNDLGKVSTYGSVNVPEIARLEKYPQVQHLVSTVEATLRPGQTHFSAFASCFPGGSITGAPKIRAMEIIDELEPVSRGPYTGAFGYLGFNRESQVSILIRAATCKEGMAHFNVGAGIVADSDPQAEYDETLAKARGFFEALRRTSTPRIPKSQAGSLGLGRGRWQPETLP